MVIALLISVAIFVLYVGGMCILFKKIPNSVSQTFYLLEEKAKGAGILFTFFCWGVVFTLAPYMIEHSDESFQWAAFLALAGMLFVGAAPHFIDEDEGKIHEWGAIFCIGFSQVWAFAHCWWIALICWIAYIIGTVIYMAGHKEDTFKETFLRTKPMFWLEITAFVSTYAVIFLG